MTNCRTCGAFSYFGDRVDNFVIGYVVFKTNITVSV